MSHTPGPWPLVPSTRFEAEWCAKQYRDTDGEWNPDLDEFSFSYHETLDLAERAAVLGGKASGIEWLRVSEQEYRAGEWVDIQRWSGDWDGGIDEGSLEILGENNETS